MHCSKLGNFQSEQTAACLFVRALGNCPFYVNFIQAQYNQLALTLMQGVAKALEALLDHLRNVAFINAIKVQFTKLINQTSALSVVWTQKTADVILINWPYKPLSVCKNV